MELPARVALLREEYSHFVADTAALCARLDALREARGHEGVDSWQALAHAGRIDELVAALLETHYDPVYLRSMARNYARFAQAHEVVIDSGSPDVLARAAAAVVELSCIKPEAPGST
jgi:tRNA 2-selenouridine synthase